MVGAFGEVYLLDWGIAVKAGEVRGDASNVIVGSPAYLAPEMARGSKELTERTDVYLLGATLHEVLTGEARHMRETAAAAVFAAGNSEPCTYDESVPRELAEVCNRACHRDPESRFPDVAAFRQAIHDHLQHHGSQSVSERAMGHLERLELKLSEGADWGAVDAFFVRRHFNRGRALFQAALEVWAENEEARAGLRALMLLMFEYEVRLRNTAGAEALLDDLADVPEALMQSLVSLQASMEKQARAQHALEEIEREQRFQGSDWGRTLIGVVSGLLWFGLIVGVAQLVSRDYLELSPKMNLAIGLLWLVSTIGIRQWFRRWLAENQIFAKFMSLVILMPLFAVLNRLVALLVERDLHDVILVDYFIVSCFTGVASVLLDRALWPATLVLAGGCLLAAAYPAQALTLAGFLALFLNVYVSWLLRPTRALKPG
jgi:serine/threonine-protein kinase